MNIGIQNKFKRKLTVREMGSFLSHINRLIPEILREPKSRIKHIPPTNTEKPNS